jgi:2-C-methyl-D-erythritol 4-phosphate cytidylyltransferase
MASFAVILPAAGSATRFGGPVNKLLVPLAGVPLIVHSLRAFLSRPDVTSVVVPTSAAASLEDAGSPELAACLRDRRVRVCAGGSNRAQSVRNALAEVPRDVEWVAVHDAARPLVSQDLIDRTFAAAREHGAAVGALPVSFTVKEADGPLPAQVVRTIPRSRLWAVQTPQFAGRHALAAAFETCPVPLDEVTDDVQLIELAGKPVWLVPGDEWNMKITRELDLRIAEGLLRLRTMPLREGRTGPAVDAEPPQ